MYECLNPKKNAANVFPTGIPGWSFPTTQVGSKVFTFSAISSGALGTDSGSFAEPVPEGSIVIFESYALSATQDIIQNTLDIFGEATMALGPNGLLRWGTNVMVNGPTALFTVIFPSLSIISFTSTFRNNSLDDMNARGSLEWRQAPDPHLEFGTIKGKRVSGLVAPADWA